MTDREKITEILKAYTKKHNISASSVILEEYAEELLANGVIVSPLKLGDKIYKIFDIESIHRKIVKIEVLKIEINFSHFCGMVKKKYIYNYNAFTNDDFGKTVFLTKEEAEKALAVRSGNNVNL